MNYFRDQKVKMFELIQNEIRESQPIEKDKLISTIEIETGASKDKTEDYLDTLENADKIKLEDGEYSVK